MKILKISGRNLASLAGEFSIDFEQEPLASSGLFAISGPTGAGKSTLLDALCVALYDATPRLLRTKRVASVLPDVGSDTVSVQDPRTLLRRGAAEGYAEVDFVGNDNLRYRARWSVRRSRGKAGGALQKQAMSLHRLHDQIALGGTNTEVAAEIVARVGLSFEQFTRAVLLAQNEFSAFLKTEENERGELLETLTGSTVYSAISRRAFERFKLEQTAMQQLTVRLADHAPLPPEARAELETQCAAADAALAVADAARLVLEQQLRWHQESDKLRLGQLQAEQALATALATAGDAAGRRQHLALLDAVEPARPLAAECARLERETAAAAEAGSAAAAELQRVQAAQLQAAGALAAASAALQAAELAQQAARPGLDQAKALDASMAALAPSHAGAAAARQGAQDELAQAAAALETTQTKLAATGAEHRQAAAWLAAHAHWDTFAAQWPRWDTLLRQAAQAHAAGAGLAAELSGAGTALDAATRHNTEAGTALQAASTQLAERDAARQRATAALAAIDGEQLRQGRQQLEQRREALAAARTVWSDLAAAGERAAQLRTQTAAITATRDQATATLAAALARAGTLDASLAQAERSLQAAETACAASVADLRATLVDGEACPVCGSADHPWQHQDATLNAMLASLREEVARGRAALQDNRATEAAQRALLHTSEQQLAAGADDGKTLEATLARLNAAWHALALAAEAPPEAQRGDWLAGELAAVRARSLGLDAEQDAHRTAAAARDKAQQELDATAAVHAGAQNIAHAAQAALAKAQAQLASLTDRHAQAARTAGALLDELDAAFAAPWREQWQAGPEQYRAAREADVLALREQTQRQAQRTAALVLLESEQGSAGKRLAQAQLASDAAASAFERIDADLAAKRAQRAALWQNRSVSDVEQELGAATDSARAALASRQQDSQLAAQAESRASEAVAQAAARKTRLTLQAQAAGASLAAWLATPGQQVTEHAQLAALLAHEHGWIAAERRALQEVDAAAASAATVLAERRSQWALHAQSAAPDAQAQDTAGAGAALDTQTAQRALAHDAASALRLQLAQDDARRTRAQSMMADIDKQQQVELRWGRLNELIGSADGKKFRNYAQQFTLDVLLGYANSHLAQLARRYRLERVVAAGGPSLGLLVRDQDMGGEIRSVNSLSGGESFLVSLALALGLASLSSNRVRVESLFIDEGFGSLDADTLRVAMDALDGLQSMGRKVGVISHVQEMTERIATRILVQPAGGGTSTVTVQ